MNHNSNFKSAILRMFPFLIAIALLTACGGAAADPAAEEAGHDEHGEEHGPEVALTAEQIKAVGLITGNMEKRGLKTALKANGRLMLPPDKSAQVSVLIGGIVRDIPVQEGQHVEKGQVLATLENIEFLQLQQDYLETQANLVVLTADLKRQQDLHTDQINATKTLERAQAELTGAKARVATMGAKLRMFGSDPARLSPEAISSTYALRAPIAGNLTHIAITLGQFAEPNKPLFDLVDNRGLHIDLNVFEQDLARVQVGQKVVFGHAGEPVGKHTATIFGMNRSFESDQQAIIVHAKLDDTSEELLPGMFIEALIMTDSTQAWSLPSEAVVSNGDEHFIFVEDEPNTFKQVPVRTGASELGYTEVVLLSELPANAKVAIKGAYYLLSELTKGSGEHNH